MKRENTRKIMVGNVQIGGQNKVVIQSMCNTKTKDIEATVKQILNLEKAGCEIIRVACLDIEDAKAIKEIKKQIHIPIVADIHFDYRIALEAIDAGVDKVRINPGNIGSEERVKMVVDKCKEKNIPIRIGVNGGSLEKDLLEKEMINMCDNLNVNLLLTTGGTGFSKRDITPEATKSVIEREALGIVEAIRFYSLQITKRAMLSRATSGIRQNTLIINLPGSPKACKEALDFVLDDVKHGIEILLGEAKECARK